MLSKSTRDALERLANGETVSLPEFAGNDESKDSSADQIAMEIREMVDVDKSSRMSGLQHMSDDVTLLKTTSGYVMLFSDAAAAAVSYSLGFTSDRTSGGQDASIPSNVREQLWRAFGIEDTHAHASSREREREKSRDTETA